MRWLIDELVCFGFCRWLLVHFTRQPSHQANANAHLWRVLLLADPSFPRFPPNLLLASAFLRAAT
ncbi:hypothetical protein [Hymenobacter crusticola]|uniref:Uncharacterized protein n=1 Tax=Hymenobacter crusticola TaxID=1770526 RepID=A0A2C9ZTX2_9BACT|nr:hypothetical protein [Hymenobacter crusticola]OUJ70161.1 hypothetical protein BXP70_25255 [Hymenobacter crusticola]